jgi:putative ABC transport system substrate-binding protein
MNRRDFSFSLAAGVAALPTARAQQAKLPVVGFLNAASPDLYMFNAVAFRDGLREAGYIEGQNVRIEYRWAEGRYERLPALAAELASLKVSAIAATGDVASARAAQSATKAIPVVFTIGGDPVRFGLVASMNRPGANVTGVSMLSNVLGAKRVQFLHEMAPKTTLIALLMNPDNPNAELEQQNAQEGARARGLKTLVLNARTPEELEVAFGILLQQRANAFITATDPMLIARRAQIVAFEHRQVLPAVHPVREFTNIGGLMNYGPTVTGMYRQAGVYIGQILKGANPAEMPVVQPTRFDLAINLKTAKTLGIVVPSSLAVLADALVE